MNIIISTNQPDYYSFVLDDLNLFEKYNVKSMVVMAITDTENLTGYWNMSLYDKIIAENEIKFDVMDEFIKNNAGRYFDKDDEWEG